MVSHSDQQQAHRAGGITRTVNAGFAHHRAGRLTRAEALYRKALERDADHAEALHLLGVIACQRGNIATAIELIERALPQLQDLPEAHLNLGNAFRAAGRHAEAADSYRRAIALQPDYGMAHSNLAGVLNDQRLFEAGLESSRRAVELIPDFPGARVNYADALVGLRRFADAEAPLRRALDLMPDRAETHHDLGRVLAELKRFEEAVVSYRRAGVLSPDDPRTHNNLGHALDALGRFDEAIESYRKALALHPNMAEVHCNLGKALYAQNRFDEAIDSYRRALALRPDFAEAHYNLGNALQTEKRFGEAVESYRAAIRVNPDFAWAYNNLGNSLESQGRLDDAVAGYRRALDLNPDFADAHSNLGGGLLAQNRPDEAEASCRRALALKPDFPEAYNNLGNAQRAQKRFDDAEASYLQALALKPDFAKAHINLGITLHAQNRSNEAAESYRRAVILAPDDANAHFGLGGVLADLGKFDEAVPSIQRGLEIAPDRPAVHAQLGNIFKAQGKLDEAVASFDRAVAVAPDDALALIGWFRERQNICDWSKYRENEAKVLRAVLNQPSLPATFPLLALSSTPAEQLECARRVSAGISVPESMLLPRREPRTGKRIRVGYLSADFRRHPVAALIAELIERHDRRSFEVIGYSCGPEDRGAMRSRFTGAFDRLVDVGKMSNIQAAQLIHADGIDILIDLMGYTLYCMPMTLAYRPAPIQVSFLGFPGTMGADFIDYIIVDRFIVPSDQQPFYTERLVHLPDSYQPSDTRREISDPGPSRADCGLPERGFVFCCFNNSYKLNPVFFDIWMRLLKAVPGSVLWLFEINARVKENLLREAACRDIGAERVIFARAAPTPEYLARLGLADLYLDTLPYNAGATANDVLWAGLPMLTCTGETYVGRMAGSVLTAAGLPELITTSLDEYEALALRLATQPKELAALRQRLARNRSTTRLFDTGRFTRNLEAAYRQMWERWKSGQPPASFAVPSQASHAVGWLETSALNRSAAS